MIAYDSMPHLLGGVMAAIDFETTGLNPDWHEVVQIAIVPLDYKFDPLPGIRPFYRKIRPEHPERFEPEAMKTNRLAMDELKTASEKHEIIESLQRWWDALGLPLGRTIVPLAHNASFELMYLRKLLGDSHYHKLFHFHHRCSMQTAIQINDKCFRRGLKKRFDSVGLEYLAAEFKIHNPCAHDALNDALVGAQLYPRLLDVDIL